MGLILNTLLGSDDAEGGGGAPAGYSFGGATSVLSQGSGSAPPGPYTVNAPAGRVPGDLLVTWAMAGPGYGGQSGIFLREGTGGFAAAWSTTGGISQFDPGVGRIVLQIAPRIATGTISDNVAMDGIGGWPVMLQMALFTNAWTGGLGSITADNENSQLGVDPSMFREDAPANGHNHLLDVWATAKKATIGAAGAIVSVDPGQPTIVLIGAGNYVDNGFGQGAVAAFGYKISAVGNPGIPTGNWGLSILEGTSSFSVSARWKSFDS